MSDVRVIHVLRRRVLRIGTHAARLLGGLSILAAGLLSTALAAPMPKSKPTVPAGFTISKLAAAPAGTMSCDDLAFLEGHFFLGCQNKTLSSGGGGNSTLVEYTAAGVLVRTWSIKDKIDGMGADPLNHRVIVTENEEGHTHLFTVAPSARATQQVVQYAYSPNPDAASAPVGLRTGGGTDQVSVDRAGHILITGSHARTRTGTAVFRVVLSPPRSPSGTGTARLSPTFRDNAMAINGNTGRGTARLHLDDVDSGAIVPQSSWRFGGSYVIANQTVPELVFASNIFNGTGLTVLKTRRTLDDMRWATSDRGTLYVVDNGGMVPGASAIYKVTGPFKQNTVLASNDGVTDQVVTVNLATGALRPFVRHLTQTSGLAYLDASRTQTELPLNGAGRSISDLGCHPDTRHGRRSQSASVDDRSAGRARRGALCRPAGDRAPRPQGMTDSRCVAPLGSRAGPLDQIWRANRRRVPACDDGGWLQYSHSLFHSALVEAEPQGATY